MLTFGDFGSAGHGLRDISAFLERGDVAFLGRPWIVICSVNAPRVALNVRSTIDWFDGPGSGMVASVQAMRLS